MSNSSNSAVVAIVAILAILIVIFLVMQVKNWNAEPGSDTNGINVSVGMPDGNNNSNGN